MGAHRTQLTSAAVPTVGSAASEIAPPNWWPFVWNVIGGARPGRLLLMGWHGSWRCTYCFGEGFRPCFYVAKDPGGPRSLYSETGVEDAVEGAVEFHSPDEGAEKFLVEGGAFLVLRSQWPEDVEAWRRELESRFDATVHLIDSESDQTWLAAFGWKNRRIESRRRSLLVTHQSALAVFGGGEIQLFETLKALRDENVVADMSIAMRLPADNYDVVHAISSYHNDKIDALTTLPTPLVVSPIFADTSHMVYMGQLSKMLIARFSDAQLVDMLDAWAGGAMAPDEETRESFGAPPDLRVSQRRLMETADALFLLTKREGRELDTMFGALATHREWVPNAVSPERFAKATEDAFVRTYGLRDFVLCAGRIEPPKNQALLIWALRDTGIPLVIAGRNFDSEYYASCRRIAGDNVHFVGALSPDMMASAYAAARVHALPSFQEVCALTTLEAALNRCALVVTNRGGDQEYVEGFAHVCDPSDWRDIRKAVLRAWEDTDPQRREACRQLVLDNYTWAHTARAIARGYETLLSRNPRVVSNSATFPAASKAAEPAEAESPASAPLPTTPTIATAPSVSSPQTETKVPAMQAATATQPPGIDAVLAPWRDILAQDPNGASSYEMAQVAIRSYSPAGLENLVAALATEALQGSSRAAHKLIAWLLLHRDDLAGTVDILQELASTASAPEPDLHLLCAEVFAKNGQREKALEECAVVLHSGPRHWRPVLARARSLGGLYPAQHAPISQVWNSRTIFRQDVRVHRHPQRIGYFLDRLYGRRVLHVGCVDHPVFHPQHNLHLQLQEAIDELYGCDTAIGQNPEFARMAKLPVYETLEIASTKGPYDVVLAPEVLEHVPNPSGFLAALFAVPAAEVIVTAPALRHFLDHEITSEGWYRETVHRDHYCYYSPYTILNAVVPFLRDTHEVEVCLLENESMVSISVRDKSFST